MPLKRSFLFRKKINRLIQNRDWNAQEVAHQEQLISEARGLKGKIHDEHYQKRMERARLLRRNAINRYHSFENRIILESISRSQGIRGLIRWILLPPAAKKRWSALREIRGTHRPPKEKIEK